MDSRIVKLLDSRFFTACARTDNRIEIEPLLREWFTVSRVFGLSSIKYLSLFVDAISTSDSKDAARFEKAMLYPLSISSGEFISENFDANKIHYKLMGILAGSFGLDDQELLKYPNGLFPETISLNEEIKKSFLDFGRGAGCFYVIEAIGYKVVDSIRLLLDRLYKESNNHLAKPENFEYISLHLVLEVQHPLIVDKFIQELDFDSKYRSNIEESIDLFVALFQNFWDRIYYITFQ